MTTTKGKPLSETTTVVPRTRPYRRKVVTPIKLSTARALGLHAWSVQLRPNRKMLNVTQEFAWFFTSVLGFYRLYLFFLVPVQNDK